MAYKRYGDPQVIIRMPIIDRRRLELGASMAGCSISEFVREAITSALDRMNVPSPEAEQIEGQMCFEDKE